MAELENRLWDAADKLRANLSLTAQEYSRLLFGLIFQEMAKRREQILRTSDILCLQWFLNFHLKLSTYKIQQIGQHKMKLQQ